MEKVRCEHCGNMTDRSAHCLFCNQPLHERRTAGSPELVQEQQLKDEYGFARRAQDADKNQRGLAIARFQILPQPADGSPPPTKKIAVQRHHRTLVFTPTTREPKVLSPGLYSVANLLLTTGRASSSSRGRAAELWRGICLCEFSLLPISATFVLPDRAALGENADVSTALSSLGLFTKDNLLVGAQVQMSLQCINPERLVQVFTGDQIGKGHIEVEEILPRPRERPNLLARWWRRIFGDDNLEDQPDEEEYLVEGEIENFTIAQLYPLIRLELAASIRTSIQNEEAKRLDDIDVRTRIQDDIQRDMATTLNAYGMGIERVAAFQFFSPDYMRLRAGRAQIAINRLGLADKEEAAKIRKQGREIEQDDITHSQATEQEIQRHKLEQAEQTSQVQDKYITAQEKRQQERDHQQRVHERTQQAADAEQQIELQRKKAAMALEINNQWKNAEMKRQQAMIQDYKGLTTEQLLTIAMIQNPQLAAAFVAAK